MSKIMGVAPSNDTSAADIACLTAARKRGLMLVSHRDTVLCPGSAMPRYGWAAQSTWSARHTDPGLGGPWSVERVSELCGHGFLGVDSRDPERAAITKAGRALLKPTPSKASTEDGAPPQPDPFRGITPADREPSGGEG